MGIDGVVRLRAALKMDVALRERFSGKKKNPACFAGEQGSRKIDDLESDRELPAYLLGEVFIRKVCTTLQRPDGPNIQP